MKRLLTYEYGSIKLYENYILSEIYDGASIPVTANNILLEIANKYYKGRPFVYISIRNHSYAVDPAVYLEASKIKNLLGFAIVTNSASALNNTNIERMFSKKTFLTFKIISEAKTWANFIVKEERNKLNTQKI